MLCITKKSIKLTNMIFHSLKFTKLQNKIAFSTTTKQANKGLVSSVQQRQISDEGVKEAYLGRLNAAHRNILLGNPPYDKSHSWIHETESYDKKLFGRYGLKSGVNSKICFLTREEKDKKAAYEAIAYPLTLQQMMEIAKSDRQKTDDTIKKREDEIANKLEKLRKWQKELNEKIAKKEADALAAKVRKDRMIEEIRRYFGFKVDPRDDRFKEMIEQKEKEDKKKQKEAKRKAKEEKMMSKLLQKNSENFESKSI